METQDRPQINIAVYVLDDDPEVIDELVQGFEGHRLKYSYFTNAEEVLKCLHDDVHILIIDYYLRGSMTGLQVVAKVLERNPDCWVIVLSGQTDHRITIAMLNGGADRYVDKNRPNMISMLHAFVEEGVLEIERRLTVYNSVLCRIAETKRIVEDATGKLSI